jgi:hypothetical protein
MFFDFTGIIYYVLSPNSIISLNIVLKNRN